MAPTTIKADPLAPMNIEERAILERLATVVEELTKATRAQQQAIDRIARVIVARNGGLPGE